MAFATRIRRVGHRSSLFVLYASSTDAEAGNVLVPGEAPWIGPFVVMFSQWAGEGSIPHDDDIDAYSQIVNWRRQRVYGLSKYYENQQAKLSGKAVEEEQEVIGPFVVMFSQWAGEGSIPHDDDIDAYSQIVNWCRQRVYGLSKYYENQQAKLSGKAVEEEQEVIAVMPDGREIKPSADRSCWVYVDTGQPVPQKANGSSTP